MNLTPERWQRVKELFDLALLQPVESRDVWLAGVSPEDPGLHEEVRGLLRALDTEPDRFERAPLIPPPLDELSRERDALAVGPGGRVGSYRLVQELGRGGMGVVFEAHRDDDQYQKRVALKTISLGRDSELILRRFRQERQILARLEHRNIAGLHDGGITPSGQPFFAMEFVAGQPIDQYCQGKRLSVQERVKLFRQVTAAVQYAHQSLVIHRDLKPSNILVTDDGTVKLLDFGIAKVLRADEDEAGLTQAEGAPLTAAFASPEQVMGTAVTTATDGFSLGVVLYLLLAGTHPFNADTPGADEVRRRIREVVPAVPSSIPPHPDDWRGLRALSRSQRDDLDSIVMMALRKEPARRYSSVEQLGEDLRRWLEGLPVAARPDSFRYRAGKFVRRNRAAVVGGAAALLMLIAGLAATIWQARIAGRERDRARATATKAERVSQFLQSLLGGADPSWYSQGERPGPSTTIGTVLETAGRQAESDLAAAPEVLADVLRTVGRANQALRRIELSYQQLLRARELHLSVFGPASPEVAMDEHELGMAYSAGGDLPQAETWMRRALATFRAASDTVSDQYGRTVGDLGLVLSGMGRPAEAEPLIRESAAHRHRFDSTSVANAILLGNLALMLSMQGKLEEAEPVYHETLSAYTRYSREYFEKGYTLGNLAVDLILRGRAEEAVPLAREQIAVFTRQLGDRHVAVGYGWVNLARALHALGKEGEALAAAQQAEAVFGHSLAAGHPDFARTEAIIGQIQEAQGRPAEAERRLRNALAIRQARLAPGSPHIADVAVALGGLLFRSKRWVEAESLLAAADRVYKGVLVPTDPRVGNVRRILVQVREAAARQGR